MFPGTEIAHFKRLHTAHLRFVLPLMTEAQAASKSWLVTEYKKGDRILYNSQTLDLCSFAAICISIGFYGHVLLCTFVHTDIHTYIHTYIHICIPLIHQSVMWHSYMKLFAVA